MTHTIEEFTERIRGVEETVQNLLQNEFDKLQKKSLKSTVASPNACSNIKPAVYDGMTSWQIKLMQTTGPRVTKPSPWC